MTTTSNLLPPINRRTRFDFVDDASALVSPDQFMKVISPTAGAFAGSYATLESTWNWAAIVWAAAVDTTNYISIPIPHITQTGSTMVKIDAGNVVVAETGDHGGLWTNYILYVFILFND